MTPSPAHAVEVRPALPMHTRFVRWLHRMYQRHWPPARTRLILALLRQGGPQTPYQVARHSHGVLTEAMARRHLRALDAQGWITWCEQMLGVHRYTLSVAGHVEQARISTQVNPRPHHLAVPCCRCQFPVPFTMPRVAWPTATPYTAVSGLVTFRSKAFPVPTLIIEQAYCAICAPFGLPDTAPATDA